MSGFLYYFPGITNVVERFRAAGLEYAFDGPPAQTRLGEGPDGGEGVALHRGELPDDVEWRPLLHVATENVGAAEGVMLGWARGRLPGPAELCRRHCSALGRQVRLGDGREWLIPRVLPDRRGRHGLPRALRCYGEDRVGFRTAREYDGLVAQAREIYADLESGGDPELRDFLVGLVGVAYRVGLPEVLALDLFGATEHVDAVMAVGLGVVGHG